MKPLWHFAIGMLIVHVAAAALALAWLGATGRINRDRVHAVVELFRHTAADQAKLDAQAAAAAALEADQQNALARLRQVASGPVSVSDRLNAERKADDLSLQRMQWIARATGDLAARLDRDKALIAQERVKLDADRKAMQEQKTTDNRHGEEDFRLAVEMIEQLKPADAKTMFQQMIEQKKMDEVIEYLAAMQMRKVGAVLREFKTPEELRQAKELIQQLRHRGLEPEPRVVNARVEGA